MGKGLTWMGDGFLLPCWCCASQLAVFLRGDSRGPSRRGRGVQGRRGTARQGHRRGAAAGGVGRGVVEARGVAIGHRRWIWLREIRRVRKVLGAAVEDFCGDFRPRCDEEIQAGEERIFWYAKQKEARSHTRGLARHA